MNYLIQPPSSQPASQQPQQTTLVAVDSLVVSELPGECKELDLLMLAQSYGRVKSCEIKRDFRNHVISVYGILNYYTIESAEAAFRALHGASYMGKVLRASWMPRNHSNPNLGNPAVPQPTTKGSRTAQVHISYLSKQLNFIISEQFLREIFGNFGTVLEIALKKTCVDPEMSVQNGYGFVHYPLTPEGIHSALMAVQNLHQVTINQITFDCSVSNQLNQILMSMERNNQRNQQQQHQQQPNFHRGRGSMFPQPDIGHGGGRGGASFTNTRVPYSTPVGFSNTSRVGSNYPPSSTVPGNFQSNFGSLPHQLHGSTTTPSMEALGKMSSFGDFTNNFNNFITGKSSTYSQQAIPMLPQHSNNYSNVRPPSTYVMPPTSSPRDQLYHTKNFSSNMDYRAVPHPPPPTASMSNLESTYITQPRHLPSKINVEEDLSDGRLSDNQSRALDSGFGMVGNANVASMGEMYVHHVPSFTSDSSGSVPTLHASANLSLNSAEFSSMFRDKKNMHPITTSLPDAAVATKNERYSPSGDDFGNNFNNNDLNHVEGVKHEGEFTFRNNNNNNTTTNNNGGSPSSYSMW